MNIAEIWGITDIIEDSQKQYLVRYFFGDLKIEALRIINTPEHPKNYKLLTYLQQMLYIEQNIIDLLNE
ncbi:MAG: hypothetical protein AAFV71_14600 [Cyanobacteria bacterium J06633_8]